MMARFSLNRTALTALVALALLPLPARAATHTYHVTMKGVSSTLSGQKFSFTAAGSMTIDDVTGDLNFTANVSNGTTLNGTGVAGVGKNVFGNIAFNQNGASGIGVIAGKASPDRKKFSGKFNVGIPNRLGPSPGGFVNSTGTIAAVEQ
jgi:hypothetical protein